jgi:flagellar biosynthetic protein FlhB
MAEETDKESKTEEPTEKKIQDAIERGNLPVSREAAVFASVAALLVIAAFLLKDALRGMTLSLEQILENPAGWRLLSGSDAILLLQVTFWQTLQFLIPIFAVLMVAGLAASFLQNAPRLVLTRIQPDWSRISPLKGWSRIFSLRGGTEFLKSFFKFLSGTVVVIALFQAQQNTLANAMFLDAAAIPEVILMIAMRLLSAISIMTILLFTVDILWVRTHWRQDLRMSRQEIKDEMKQSEGDPMMKARLRSIALDRLRKSMISAVPRATLVIANPTHYAIALRFVREEGGAPVVLSKGKDLIALKIRAIAEEHGIPVIEDKPLARSLYDSVEINRTIPPEFYRAVAELLHFLYAKNARKVSVQ